MGNVAELKAVEYWFRTDCKSPLITFVARLNGRFREKFELLHFPFDRQWLTARFTSAFHDVRFMCEWPRDWPKTAPTEDFINLYGFILEEWACEDAVCVQARPTKSGLSASGKSYHGLNVKLLLARQPGYYLWNVAFIDCMLVVISLFVLLVPPEEFGDRMAMSLTLLLTAIAFKQVVSSHLPPVSYLTWLDKYVLCGFGMQCLVIIQNAIAKVIRNYEDEQTRADYHWFDRHGGLVLLVYMLGYQGYFAILAWRRSTLPSNVLKRFRDEAPHSGHKRWHRITQKSDKSSRTHNLNKDGTQKKLQYQMEESESDRPDEALRVAVPGDDGQPAGFASPETATNQTPYAGRESWFGFPAMHSNSWSRLTEGDAPKDANGNAMAA